MEMDMRREIFSFVLAGCSFSLFAVNYQWRNPLSGDFDSPACWNPNSSYPQNAADLAFWSTGAQGASYTVSLPEGVTTNCAALYVVGFNNTLKSITIDTTEGALYQAPSTYQSDWQGFGF